MTLTYGSVCSGIEAATEAWHPLGWEPKFFSEIDPWCRAYLRHNYPGVPLHGDLKTIRKGQYGPIDLLVGGTPCQGFSVAGHRKGLGDDRSNLALGYVELARLERPKWLVWENVPGAFSTFTPADPNGDLRIGREWETEATSDFAAFCAALSELGYGLAWRVLDTQFVRVERYPRAIPQRRRRILLVGYLGDWRPAAACLLEPGSLRGDPPPSRGQGQDVAGTLGGSSQSGGFRTTDLDNQGAFIPEVVGSLNHSSGHAVPGNCSQDWNAGMLVPEVAGSMRAEGFDASEDGSGRQPALIPEVANPLTHRMHKGVNTTADEGQTMVVVPFDSGQVTSPDNRTRSEPGDPSPALNSSKPPGIAFSCKDDGRDATEDVAPTLRAMSFDKSHANGGGQLAYAYHDIDWRVRRLTCTECERLQGFRDGATNIPWRKKNGSPDSRRYASLGNTMSINVMSWLGQRIDFVHKLKMEMAA